MGQLEDHTAVCDEITVRGAVDSIWRHTHPWTDTTSDETTSRRNQRRTSGIMIGGGGFMGGGIIKERCKVSSWTMSIAG